MYSMWSGIVIPRPYRREESKRSSKIAPPLPRLRPMFFSSNKNVFFSFAALAPPASICVVCFVLGKLMYAGEKFIIKFVMCSLFCVTFRMGTPFDSLKLLYNIYRKMRGMNCLK